MFKKVFRETDRFDFMSLLDSLSPKFRRKNFLFWKVVCLFSTQILRKFAFSLHVIVRKNIASSLTPISSGFGLCSGSKKIGGFAPGFGCFVFRYPSLSPIVLTCLTDDE